MIQAQTSDKLMRGEGGGRVGGGGGSLVQLSSKMPHSTRGFAHFHVRG